MVGIVIPFRNCLDYTKAAIESIRVTVDDFVLVLIDDGSHDGSFGWAKQHSKNHFKVVTLDGVRTPSLAAKWNDGIKLCALMGISEVVVANNDVLFHPKTIDNMVLRLRKKDVVIVTGSNASGACKKPEDIFDLPIPEKPDEPTAPDFSCFAIKVDAWKMIGGFDERYVPCYFEDNDIHWTLMAHDLVAIKTTAAPYYHYGSVTQKSVIGGACKPEQFEKNKKLFVQKFGGMPDQLTIESVKKVLHVSNDV